MEMKQEEAKQWVFTLQEEIKAIRNDALRKSIRIQMPLVRVTLSISFPLSNNQLID